MRYLAVVTHNHGPEALWTYRGGAPLAEATRFHVVADTPHVACEWTWLVCNVDTPSELPDHLTGHATDTARYRRRRNRSLSMGDVVILTPDPASNGDAEGSAPTGEMTAWAAIDVGFTQLAHVPDYAVDDPDAETSTAYQAMLAWRDGA